jgi:hypothetical protein
MTGFESSKMLIQKQSLPISYISFLFISFLLLTGFSGVVKNENKSDDLTIKAIVRADNDFVTYNDEYSERESIPEIVSKKIRSILDECKTDYIRYDNSKECEYSIFRIKYTNIVSIYIAKVNLEPTIRYYLIAYDSKTSRITNKPPWIYGSYMENDEEGFVPESRLLEKPLIYFSRFDSKNSKGTVVIKKRAHNGTSYNAVIDNYYSIDAYMNLKNFLCIETKSFADVFGDCLINRTLKDNIIVSTMKCENDEQPKLLGSVRLEMSENNVQIVSTEVKDKRIENDKRFLVTASGVEEETFLKGQ